MPWNEDIGFLNCSLSLEYLMEASKAACAMPNAWDAIPILPPSKVSNAILKPAPSESIV